MFNLAVRGYPRAAPDRGVNGRKIHLPRVPRHPHRHCFAMDARHSQLPRSRASGGKANL